MKCSLDTSKFLWLFPYYESESESEVTQLCPTLCDPVDPYQAPPSMGFSRQEYWSGLPFPSPGDLTDPGIKPGSPALEADALTSNCPLFLCCFFCFFVFNLRKSSYLLAILWNSGFSWVYLSLSSLLFTSLCSALCQAFSGKYFPFCISFSFDWFWQCYEPLSIVLQALCQIYPLESICHFLYRIIRDLT